MAGYKFSEVETEMKEYWKELKLLDKLELKNKQGERYFLLDGPPYANFVPHVGHIRNTVYKDLYVRWAFMKGHNVLFQPGFDTHGLPIENMVEKKLDIKCKQDIVKIGIPKFMKECRDSAALNKDLWMDVYDRLGSWYSWKVPYLTYDNTYIESAWWSFKQIWDKDLVYEGKKPVHWCPKCETSLAGYETTDSYKNVTDPAIFVKFKLKDSDEQVVVYTTTPWTLPANVAIAAHPDAEYAVVSTTSHGKLIIANKQLKLLQELEIGFTVEKIIKGSDLDGKQYVPLLEDMPTQQNLSDDKYAHKIYMSMPILKERISSKVAMKKGIEAGDVFEDFVTDEEGTGFVHIAPGHGKTDSEVGKHYNLPAVSPLDDQCNFTEDAGQFEGRFVKEADHDIAELIREKGKLLHYDKVNHSYPLCWRCKSPLIFRLSNQWFIKISNIKEKMLEANEKVNWQPDFAKERFHEWVANAEDWNFSRQRFWGIPIPIWKCECGNKEVVDSVETLNAKSINDLPADFDLHNAGEVEILCGCGKHMKRVGDIFDVWFDSGCAPYASLHYPFENKEVFDTHFPVSRVNESQDQVRGWFYSLMCNSIATFGKAPYETVSMPGWVLDEKGEKMSKSLGNVTWAKEGMEDLGADQIRFYYCWDINPADTQKFNKGIIRKEISKYFSVFWNMQNLLANSAHAMKEPVVESAEDRWIISRLNTVIRTVREYIEGFRLHQAGRLLHDFVINDLSRTYIQLTRDRMADDNNPYFVVNKCMKDIMILTASITPFFSDKIYQQMKVYNTSLSEDSVHLELLPDHDEKLCDAKLEEDFEVIRGAIGAILNAREKAQLGVRWPVKMVTVLPNDDKTKKAIEDYSELIKTQTNVKEIKMQDTMPEVKQKISADYGKLGPEYGDITPQIITKLTTESSESILNKIRKDGQYIFHVDTREVKLTEEHLKIERDIPQNLTAAEFNQGLVYLDKFRTEELEAEGFARELMRRVQSLRKDGGMQKSDVISLFVKSDADMKGYFETWTDAIMKKVGAESAKFSENDPSKVHEHTSVEKVKGKEFTIYLSKE